MKLEKRNAGAPETPEAVNTPEDHSGGGKKPVIVYIMILFIVAFLLMALSFLMHQRSNSEAIGQLTDQVTALQEVQATQNENIQLQKDLEELQRTNQDLTQQLQQLQKDAENQSAAADSLKGQLDAMEALYALQQQYAAKDYDACKKTIHQMEEDGLDLLLPAQLEEGYEAASSPAQRYLQLREAVNG